MPSLAHTHPALADQWVTTSDGKTPNDVTAGSAYRATWQCPTCNHTWTAVTYSRTRGAGCPQCKRAVISANRSRPKPGHSLAEKYPHIAAEWDPDRNDISPRQVAAHGRLVAAWTCAVCGHEWQASVTNRTKNGGVGHGCPGCFASKHSAHMRIAVGGPSIAEAFPDMAGEWDWSAAENIGASPETVKARSGIQRGWKCHCGHAWIATPANRSRGHGCARCRQRIGSAQEAAMLLGFRAVCPEASPSVVRRLSARRPWSVDALDEASRLIVEFDGSYWHGTKANPRAFERDRLKTKELVQQGWTVVRVREEPLQVITNVDLLVPLGCTGSALATRVAAHVGQILT